MPSGMRSTDLDQLLLDKNIFSQIKFDICSEKTSQLFSQRSNVNNILGVIRPTLALVSVKIAGGLFWLWFS